MSYLVYDLETGSKEIYKRKGNFMFNPIIAIGYKYQQDQEALTDYHNQPVPGWLKNVQCLIGFNIKFDLLYLWGTDELQEYFKRGGKIFDCQLAEFCLSGQQNKYPALRETAVSYGAAERPKHMEEYWDRGVDTSEIPRELVLEDVKQDVLDTEAVFLAQVERAEKLGMLSLINSQMDALLATTEMEYNGLHIDQQVLETNKQELLSRLETNKTRLQELIEGYWPKENQDFNPESPYDVSKLLFGGEFKLKGRTPQKDELGNAIYIKSGKNKGEMKMKNIEIIQNWIGLGLKPKKEWKQARKYSTDESVLSQLIEMIGSENPATEILELLLVSRSLNKEIGTYYTGFQELIYPDGKIRGNLNFCKTETARLSSDKPNLQNISK